MKKQIWYVLLTALLCLTMAFSLTACDDENETTTADDGTTAAPDGDGSSTPDGDNDGTTAPKGDSSTTSPSDGGSNTPNGNGSGTSNGEGSGTSNGDGANTSHTHSYATTWSSNETHHWHAATCEHSDEKSEYAEHAWGEGVITTPATCGSVGTLTYTCTCGKTKTEDIPKLTTHTYSAEWTKDETHHWHAATCTHSDEKSEYAEHTWGEGMVTTPATCSNVGTLTYTCTCGKTKTEKIPKLTEHTYGTNQICTVCGCRMPTEGLLYTLNSDGQSYCVSGIDTATDTDIVIASTYEGLPVTSIGYRAFYDCTSLTSITIPDSVTIIGYYAFYYCTSLTSITIPDSVTSIGSYAFRGCTSLTSITIPDSVTWIGDYAFWNCTSLTSITIPDSVTSIGQAAFLNCENLNYTTFDNAKYLGNENTPYLVLIKVTDRSVTSFTMQESTKIIYSSAFFDCYNLTSITIPDNVTSIGDCAFEACTSLESITIPDGVMSIGEGAFTGCWELSIVYYTGTAEEWSAISIDSNYYLTSATRYYYSETEPTDADHLYWHYVESVPTPWEN